MTVLSNRSQVWPVGLPQQACAVASSSTVADRFMNSFVFQDDLRDISLNLDPVLFDFLCCMFVSKVDSYS